MAGLERVVIVGGGVGGLTTALALRRAGVEVEVHEKFFSEAESHSVTISFEHAAPIVMALFLVAAVLALALPRTAVSEEDTF